MTDKELMELALKQGELAFLEGEVPIGAVVSLDGQVISVGRNKRETIKNALSHAELEAIDGACRALGGWRLHRCELFVTLEPCPMCAGAIINARIKRVVFGAYDKKQGCFGSVSNFNSLPFNHKVELVGGFMEEESKKLLQDFFRELRERKKLEK